jgi:hypothetical protein
MDDSWIFYAKMRCGDNLDNLTSEFWSWHPLLEHRNIEYTIMPYFESVTGEPELRLQFWTQERWKKDKREQHVSPTWSIKFECSRKGLSEAQERARQHAKLLFP